MRYFFRILCVLCLVSVLSIAHAESVDLESFSYPELLILKDRVTSELLSRASLDEFTIAYSNVDGRIYRLIDIEMSEDYSGKPMLLLSFAFFNGTDQTVRWAGALFLSAKQEEKNCEITLNGYGIDDLYTKDFKPGEMHLCQAGIVLHNPSSPVYCELKGYSSPVQRWTITPDSVPQYQEFK